MAHAATGLLEIGNTSLDKESSNNLEFGLRKHSGIITGEFSAYYNEISDYIFLDVSAEAFEGKPIASYLAGDATFRGQEAEVSFDLIRSPAGNLVLSFFGDIVKARFEGGGDVPRIPASKLGAELRYFGNNWSVHLHATRISEQDDVGSLEIPTDGHTLVSIYADSHWALSNGSDIKLFVRGDNLLDEEIRNHASFLKNIAPEAGRGFRLGVRWEY